MRFVLMKQSISRLGRRRALSSSSSLSGADLLTALRQLDTASLCDADKTLLQNNNNGNSSDTASSYCGLNLLDGKIRPINKNPQVKMVGFAFTVQCTVKNDFLAVLRGILEATSLSSSSGQTTNQLVLVVDTLNSIRAVAGELFATQAAAQTMAGLLVDGPVRDAAHLHTLMALPVFATHTCPYAGTIQHPGLTQGPVQLAPGVTVNPGDVIFGDADGIVTANVATMQQLLPVAQQIVATEAMVRERIESGRGSLATLTNAHEHVAARMQGQESNLEFRL